MAGSLESLIFGIRRVFSGGVELPLRSDINFTGATIVDNESENRLDIDLFGDIEKDEIAVGTINPLPDTSTVVVAGVTCAGGDIEASAIACDGLIEATPGAGIEVALATGGALSVTVNGTDLFRWSRTASEALMTVGATQGGAGFIASGAAQYLYFRASGAAGSMYFDSNDTNFRNNVGGNTVLRLGNNTLAFYGTAPVARPTGVAVTAAAIHAALVSLGLITA